MKRYTPGLCAHDLHDITLPGALNGAGACRECQYDAAARWEAGQAIPQNQDQCRKGHPYTEENTYIIPSTGRRTCRRCQRISNARSKIRKALKDAAKQTRTTRYK